MPKVISLAGRTFLRMLNILELAAGQRGVRIGAATVPSSYVGRS